MDRLSWNNIKYTYEIQGYPEKAGTNECVNIISKYKVTSFRRKLQRTSGQLVIYDGMIPNVKVAADRIFRGVWSE